MEEPEVSTEHLQEEIGDKVSQGADQWTLGVALSCALLAAMAAVASMTVWPLVWWVCSLSRSSCPVQDQAEVSVSSD